MRMAKICKECRKQNRGLQGGYYSRITNVNCPKDDCLQPLIDTILTEDEFDDLWVVSRSVDLVDAMIELKEKDLIEFELKMGQFHIQAKQIYDRWDAKRKAKEEQKNIVKCPKCQNTDIGVVNRGHHWFWGFAGSGDPMNVCKKCGYKWRPGR